MHPLERLAKDLYPEASNGGPDRLDIGSIAKDSNVDAKQRRSQVYRLSMYRPDVEPPSRERISQRLAGQP